MCTVEQVEEFLIVDLDIGALDQKLQILIALSDAGEKPLNGSGNEAFKLRIMVVRSLKLGLVVTSMVHVLPPPVCPYAKMVPLKPDMTAFF